MNAYIYSLKEVTAFLESLPIDPHQNALWDVLHLARWHLNIDWVKWVAENKELVTKIIAFNYISDIPAADFDQINDILKKYSYRQ